MSKRTLEEVQAEIGDNFREGLESGDEEIRLLNERKELDEEMRRGEMDSTEYMSRRRALTDQRSKVRVKDEVRDLALQGLLNEQTELTR